MYDFDGVAYCWMKTDSSSTLVVGVSEWWTKQLGRKHLIPTTKAFQGRYQSWHWRGRGVWCRQKSSRTTILVDIHQPHTGQPMLPEQRFDAPLFVYRKEDTIHALIGDGKKAVWLFFKNVIKK
jgi:hypothetical protein